MIRFKDKINLKAFPIKNGEQRMCEFIWEQSMKFQDQSQSDKIYPKYRN